MWFVAVLFLVTCLMPFQLARCAEPDADPILGDWLWFGKKKVTVHADGTVKGWKLAGKWTYQPAGSIERHYIFVWKEGVSVDTLTLSQDFQRLKGKNRKGSEIFARRTITDLKQEDDK
jgi:hypothetical protein